MTGKTHMAISAAIVAVALSAASSGCAAGHQGSSPFSCLASRLSDGPVDSAIPVSPVSGPQQSSGPRSAFWLAGLLVLGMVAGLFPDLDAPDTELQHLPRKAAYRLGRYAAYVATGLPGIPGLQRRSPPGRLVRRVLQGAIDLAALPFTLLVDAVGTALRTVTGHRGFTHSLLGTLFFTCLVCGVALLIAGSAHSAAIVGAVWLLGYASHLAADACTPSGIPLLMPLKPLPERTASSNRTRPGVVASRYPNVPRYPRYHGYHILPRRMRVRTGTLADTLLIRWTAWIICAGALLYLIMA